MNSKERQEMLDLYKHISAGLMERKGDRLMLSKTVGTPVVQFQYKRKKYRKPVRAYIPLYNF